MKKTLVILCVFTLILGLAGVTWATPITFTRSSGDLAASVIFDTSGTNLVVTLSNTTTGDVLVPTDVLTAVFFTLTGDPTLDPVSAILNTGSTVIYASQQPPDGNVGGEWAYKGGLSGAPLGANQGISAAGLGLFGPKDLFPGDPSSKNPPDGLGYGITSAGDNEATGNTGVTKNPLINNSVVFTITGLSAGFDPSTAITDVSFQYGTELNAVPEPATIFLLGSGLVGLGLWGRRRFKARS